MTLPLTTSDSPRSAAPVGEGRAGDRDKFALLTGARRVWAVGSIHGERARLDALHDRLWGRLEAGDRLVYLGNVLGRGPDVAGTIDELLAFRCGVMALEPSAEPHVVVLRGSQEEMWQKLLQLQFATDPRSVLEWMLGHGLGATLAAYGSSAEEARERVRGGTVGLTRWTQALRKTIQAREGHTAFMAGLRRACAVTGDGPQAPALLCVNAGLDPKRPLDTQKDSFWWASRGFGRLAEPYAGFARVVRGFAVEHPGIEFGDFTATVDAGCGFGGPLTAACLAPDGTLLEVLEA
jgi:serine/threonine protein phosphatase 1